MSINDKLLRLSAARSGIIAALGAKGVTATGHGFEDFAADVAAIETGPRVEALIAPANGVYTAPAGTAYSPVTVNVSSGETPEAELKDVNFYDDWVGRRIYSYTAAEFLAMSAMPEDPTHDGAVAQGWNWALADAQAYVTAYGGLEIGQMYDLDDEDGAKTRIYVTVEAGQEVTLILTANERILWGDGTAAETDPATARSHTYQTAGSYCIKLLASGNLSGVSNVLNAANGYSGEGGDAASDCVTRIEMGKNTSYISYSIKGLRNLETLILPYTVTSVQFVQYCPSLKGLTLPSGVGNMSSTPFMGNTNMRYFAGSKTATVKAAMHTFGYCRNLRRLTMAEGSTYLPGCREAEKLERVLGPATSLVPTSYAYYKSALKQLPNIENLQTIQANMFQYCSNLEELRITGEDKRVGGAAFQYCRGAKSIVLDALVTATGAGVFRYCTKAEKITATANGGFIADSTSYNYGFAECTALTEVDFSLARSVDLTGTYSFSGCTALKKVIFGVSTGKINNYCFQNCSSLDLLDFRKADSVPALGSTNAIPIRGQALSPIAPKIVVPDALYNDWIAATNWSNVTLQQLIVKASDYEEEER